MRSQLPKLVEDGRVKTGRFASTKDDGMNGFFDFTQPGGANFHVMCSDGMGWEHVSVSLPDRCPTWGEMCWIKDLFWNEDETVIQYHPSRADYKNLHPHCLHMWRPILDKLPKPPKVMVAP